MDRKCKLKPRDRIRLAKKPECDNLKEWVIDSIVGEGSFSVCYSATSGDISGRLKEFYPVSNVDLKRNKNNQLVTGETFERD